MCFLNGGEVQGESNPGSKKRCDTLLPKITTTYYLLIFTAPKHCFGSLKMSNVRAEIQDECLEVIIPFYTLVSLEPLSNLPSMGLLTWNP